MMYVDLHIHTALSPCASDDMTPNNIVNMALLKGLDAIAVTDHNSSLNVRAVVQVAKGRIKVIPGMEVQSREDVHILCLFDSCEGAERFQEVIYRHLPPVSNREEIFGRQLIMDCNDDIVGVEDRLLLNAVNLSVEDICALSRDCGGISIPAHVDRQGFGMLYQLGFIPDNLLFTHLEVSRHCDIPDFLRAHPELMKYHIIKSSDAHQLGDILERYDAVEICIPDLNLY
ncbi:PHP domain-containing protein [Caldanaerobius polysaccharolyticus]|uniref:PHP domain-containing protein n=1 Tax=Caldanaerobius polysaccharolyticus TaxID=44256 RepID=UPI00047D3F2C|nr:PHP domain-containing protein [Caldanaerobius polysaccharolyticus]